MPGRCECNGKTFEEINSVFVFLVCFCTCDFAVVCRVIYF